MRHFHRLISGLVAVLLLLPLPAFAFTLLGSDWTIVGTPTAGAYYTSSGTGTGATLGIVTPTGTGLTSTPSITLTRQIEFNSTGTERLQAVVNNGDLNMNNANSRLTINIQIDGVSINTKTTKDDAFPFVQTGNGNVPNFTVNQFSASSGSPATHTLTVTFSISSTGGTVSWKSTNSPTTIFTFNSI